MIQMMEGYDRARQTMLFNDTILHDWLQLSDPVLGITESSVLQLVVSAPEDPEERPPMRRWQQEERRREREAIHGVDTAVCIACGSANPWRCGMTGCDACRYLQCVELRCLRQQQEDAAAGVARAGLAEAAYWKQRDAAGTTFRQRHHTFSSLGEINASSSQSLATGAMWQNCGKRTRDGACATL